MGNSDFELNFSSNTKPEEVPSIGSKMYVALARKWRPAQFKDLVGQESVARTLSNAIRSERLHHAYLLTGSRGIGKTSIARIFSKVIRCVNQSYNSETQSLESCDHCSNCHEIAASQSVDVLEIDGASNNGVEAVREIRENAKFLPASGKRKIYIIDEVHMLTTAAFNALLKTLEEPPEHIIFIFATTEPHKIPPTILSRCQKFDLRKVTPNQIQQRLKKIVDEEGVSADSAALALIARAGEGSMRDALSLLDQVIAYADGNITVESARESIGIVESQSVFRIVEAIFKNEPLEALQSIQKIYDLGHDLKTVVKAIQSILHLLILVKVGGPEAARHFSSEYSEAELEEWLPIAKLRSLEFIEMFFQVFHQGYEWIAHSPQPKNVLDILVIKCARAHALGYLSPARELPKAESPKAEPQKVELPKKATTPTPARVVQPQASQNFTRTLSYEASAAPSIGLESEAFFSTVKTQPQAIQPEPQAPVPQLSIVPNIQLQPAANSTWEGWVQMVKIQRPVIGAALEHAVQLVKHPLTQDESGAYVLGIQFQPNDQFFMQQLQSRSSFDSLMQMARSYFQVPLRINLEIVQMGSSQGKIESLAAKRERELKEKEEAAKQAVLSNPILAEARALFGGELGPIRF